MWFPECDNTTIKYVKHLFSNTPDFPLREVERVLKRFGFVRTAVRGSHFRYERNVDGEVITVPVVKGRKVKRWYVRNMIDQLHLEEWIEDCEGRQE